MVKYFQEQKSKMRLTFEEGSIFVGIDIDFCEFSNANLFRDCKFEPRIRVETISVRAKSVRLEFLLTKGNAERYRKELVSTFRKHELFGRAADHL